MQVHPLSRVARHRDIARGAETFEHSIHVDPIRSVRIAQLIHALNHALYITPQLIVMMQGVVHHRGHTFHQLNVSIGRLDERIGALPREKVLNGSDLSINAFRLRMGFRLMKRFLAFRRDTPPQRIQSTHQRPIWVDPAALRGYEHAGALIGATKRRPASFRVASQKLRRTDATIACQPGDFIWIELDDLVVAATAAGLALV